MTSIEEINRAIETTTALRDEARAHGAWDVVSTLDDELDQWLDALEVAITIQEE